MVDFILCVRTYVQMYVPDKIRILIVSGHKSKSQNWILFMSGHKSNSQNIKYGLFMSNVDPRKEQNMDYLCPDTSKNRKRWILFMSGHKSKSQKMDLIYVRTQVKIAKDGNYV